MDRKTRFYIGFLLAVLIFSLPIVGCAYAGLYLYLAFFMGAFAFSVYLIYRVTIRNIKLRYPVVNPEGIPTYTPDVWPDSFTKTFNATYGSSTRRNTKENPTSTKEPRKNDNLL